MGQKSQICARFTAHCGEEPGSDAPWARCQSARHTGAASVLVPLAQVHTPPTGWTPRLLRGGPPGVVRDPPDPGHLTHPPSAPVTAGLVISTVNCFSRSCVPRSRTRRRSTRVGAADDGGTLPRRVASRCDRPSGKGPRRPDTRGSPRQCSAGSGTRPETPARGGVPAGKQPCPGRGRGRARCGGNGRRRAERDVDAGRPRAERSDDRR